MTGGHRDDIPRWVGLAVAVTLLPDLDFVLPWVTHRGVTHSLVAAVCLGVVVAVVAAVGWKPTASRPGGLPAVDRARRALLGFVVGSGCVVGHLVGDLITPMGIRPFFPVDAVYTLNLVYAKDIGANLAVFVIGLVVFWTVARLSKDPVPTDRSTPGELAADSEISPLSP